MAQKKEDPKTPTDGLPPGPAPLADVQELPADRRELVDRMLAEGATFEDVFEALRERSGPAATLQAIQNFYRGSLDLQRRRVQCQVERARQLQASFADPDSTEAQLAQAAILTGLQALTRKGAQMSTRETLHAYLEREVVRLRRELLRVRLRREAEEQRFRRTKLRSELTKLHLARIKLQQFRRLVMQAGKDKILGAEAMEKIQEVYGVLRLPVVPRDPEWKDEPGM